MRRFDTGPRICIYRSVSRNLESIGGAKLGVDFVSAQRLSNKDTIAQNPPTSPFCSHSRSVVPCILAKLMRTLSGRAKGHLEMYFS